MCKTGTTPNKRPMAFGQQQQPSSGSQLGASCVNNVGMMSQQGSGFQGASPYFFSHFYNPAFMQVGTRAHQLNETKSFFLPQQQFTPSSFAQTLSNQQSAMAPAWLQQQLQQQALLASLAQQTNNVQGCADLLNKPSLNSSLPSALIDNSFIEVKKPRMETELPCGSTLLTTMQSSVSNASHEELAKRVTVKRTMPDMISDSNSEESSSVSCKSNGHIAKKTRANKKHEATLDGERRVAIEFESTGTLGALPQTYGKGFLIVPDGLTGKYSAFGQRWRFSITHSLGPVICEDGIQRMCLAWSVTNLNSEHTHTVVETPSDAMKRDRDGKTLCNRVFRDALSLRASALESELRKTNDASVCVDLQSQLKTIQTKRFSEGPLFFGLRHASLQTEMRKQLEKRKVEGDKALGVAKPMDMEC